MREKEKRKMRLDEYCERVCDARLMCPQCVVVGSGEKRRTDVDHVAGANCRFAPAAAVEAVHCGA